MSAKTYTLTLPPSLETRIVNRSIMDDKSEEEIIIDLIAAGFESDDEHSMLWDAVGNEEARVSEEIESGVAAL